MSELSDKIRSEFKKADDERDALMNTPEDIERWDNIVYGHDDREMQRLDVYRPKQAQGEDLPIIISVHGGAWMYGDKDKIHQIYMCPVVMSTTYGEQEAKLNLSNAWEILGGLPASGICGYIKDVYEFEQNKDYVTIIEKKAEDLYRTIHQKIKSLPASNQAVSQSVALNKGMELTPQESEQLSKYASDEIYVQKQKEDIQELSALFKGMLGKHEGAQIQQIYAPFETHFHPLPGQKGLYKIELTDREDVFYIKIEQHELEILEETGTKPDIEMTLTEEVLQKIIQGQETFQKAFMTGNIKMKGDFGLFRMLDEMFIFR